jgi:hypothetical protein
MTSPLTIVSLHQVTLVLHCHVSPFDDESGRCLMLPKAIDAAILLVLEGL